MLKHFAKAELTNKGDKDKVFAEVNWNKKDKDCIKFTIGNKTAIIPRAELFQLLFTVSNPIQQAEMMPVKTELVRPFARKHIVKLTKDLKKGDTVNVHCEVNIPEILVEHFKKKFLNKNSIVPLVGSA